MTMFADARNDNYYNTDFLNEKDKEFVNGYDWCAEAVQNFLKNNLDISESDIPDELYEVLSANNDVIAQIIDDWVESERDMVVASLIDNMDEQEYEQNRERAMKDNPDKEYFDTRKYAITGIKVNN